MQPRRSRHRTSPNKLWALPGVPTSRRPITGLGNGNDISQMGRTISRAKQKSRQFCMLLSHLYLLAADESGSDRIYDELRTTQQIRKFRPSLDFRRSRDIMRIR